MSKTLAARAGVSNNALEWGSSIFGIELLVAGRQKEREELS
jgi:hypothetical protein